MLLQKQHFKALAATINQNKETVDSRLRPQSCCHLANCIEMQEILDCKLDANKE